MTEPPRGFDPSRGSRHRAPGDRDARARQRAGWRALRAAPRISTLAGDNHVAREASSPAGAGSADLRRATWWAPGDLSGLLHTHSRPAGPRGSATGPAIVGVTGGCGPNGEVRRGPSSFHEPLTVLATSRALQVARVIAGLLAACTIAAVLAAVVHDDIVVSADLGCRGRSWNELITRKREEKGGVIARACTPGLISALSSRPATSPAEAACDSAYYPLTTDAEYAAIMSACHLAARPATGERGFMLRSTRAWRDCAAAVPALQFCARDVWLISLGTTLLAIVLVLA